MAGAGGGGGGTIFGPTQRKKQEDERFALTPQQYLERYHVQVYLEDAIRVALDARDERPLEVLYKYFNSVLQGNHVLLRSYDFISKTPRNRLAFVRLLVETYRNVQPDSEMPAEEHHQLVTLICPDFPTNVHEEAKTYMMPSSTNCFHFKTLSAYFQVLFIFSEFLDSVKRLFEPPNTEDRTMTKTNFLWAVRNVINTRHWEFSCPAASLLESILANGQNADSNKDTVTYTQFLLGMTKCESIVISPPAASRTSSNK